MNASNLQIGQTIITNDSDRLNIVDLDSKKVYFSNENPKLAGKFSISKTTVNKNLKSGAYKIA